MESIARVRDLKLDLIVDLIQAYMLWISMFRHVDFEQLVDFVDFDI